ncbi:acyclic terpene utilization AtuA family protein [Streptomyces sp. NPDC048385]
MTMADRAIAATRIACGAGFSGDRFEPAADLLDRGDLDYLVLECLAERTMAAGTLRHLSDPLGGYDPFLERRLAPLLPAVAERGTKVVTNLGAADPAAAGRAAARLARRLELDLAFAVVTGDEVTDALDPRLPAQEDGRPLADHGRLISAHAYLGADAVRAALDAGADVVITGRVADPSLFVGCLAHHRGWDLGDADQVAHGTLVGHLLECAGQVTGGYFADPPLSEIPGLAHLGFPVAEVTDTDAVITKLPGTGGRVDAATVAEQLGYEIGDPARYLTPDVHADFSAVTVTDLGGDRVRVSGSRGRLAPADLKVSVGFQGGFRCEAEIDYAGTGARRRAELAAAVVRERTQGLFRHLHDELLGVDPIAQHDGTTLPGSGRCRLSLVAQADDAATAARLGEEVTALYTNGPAGGGGVRVTTEPVLGVLSSTVSRKAAAASIDLLRSGA